MSAILFRCPVTRKTIDIRLESDKESMLQMRKEEITVDCPHCGKKHTFRLENARLRDRLKD